MGIEAIKTVADYVAGLGFDACKDRIKGRMDETKLKSALIAYIERQRKYNDICTIAEEIDFQGLAEYISSSLIDDTVTRVFDPNKKKRATARQSVIDRAVAYSKADTEERKKRVGTLVAVCLDIVHDFYKSQFTPKEYLLAAEIVDAVSEAVTDAVSEAVTEDVTRVVKTTVSDAVIDLSEQHKDMTSSVDVLAQKIDEMPGKMLEIIDGGGKLFSIDKAVSLAESGNLSVLQGDITTFLDHISLSHPCRPYYRYDIDKGQLISKPLNTEAKKLFPPKLMLTGNIRFGDRYFNDPKGDPLDYAYRHQLSLVMEVTKAVKLLGDKEDPIQTEVERLTGNTIVIKPPEFPSAFPCSIKVSEKTFFEYVLLRTQEILDDGTYVVSNKEQGIPLSFEVRINPANPSRLDFSISVVNATNKMRLKYLQFMDALSKEKDLHIYVLSAGEDIIAGTINEVNYQTGFATADEEIDFIKRLCVIEDYYNVVINLDGDISYRDYENVMQLSGLIQNDEVTGTWEEATLTGIMDQNFRDKLRDMDDEPSTFSYVGVTHLVLFGTEFDVRFMRTFKNGRLKDIDRIKRKVEDLDDGDTVKLTFCAGEDKTVVDTLKIPEKMNQE